MPCKELTSQCWLHLLETICQICYTGNHTSNSLSEKQSQEVITDFVSKKQMLIHKWWVTVDSTTGIQPTVWADASNMLMRRRKIALPSALKKKKKTKLLALNMQTVTHSTDPVFEDSLTVAWKLVEEFSTWVWVMDLQHLVIVPYVDQSIRNPTAVPLKLHSTGCVELIFIRPWVCVRSFTAQCHLPNISILVQLCLTSRKLNVTHKNSDIYR